MAQPYYTDEMREATASLFNEFEFPLTIQQLEDGDGPYLAIVFSNEDYIGYEKNGLEIIAQYLIDLRNTLIALGARVTFLVESSGHA